MTSPDTKPDLVCGDILVEFNALGILSDIAGGYIQLGADDRLVTLIDDAAARARALVKLKHALVQAKRDADLNGEAAVEYRAERDGRPTTRSAA